MFKELKEAINWIETRVKFRPKTSLSHMKHALSMLHLDLKDIKKVHVTGTNGKGSVCMMTTTILVESGLNVGTFVSPYLLKFNERIKYNGIDITDDELLESINQIYNLNEQYYDLSKQTLSFFELMTLMAFTYFVKKKVDVMVVEVGIGGLLDATNILDYDVSVITNVGLDHMKQLGDSLEAIAINKLGILKEKGVLITTVQENLYNLFNVYADHKHAKIMFIDPAKIKTINQVPHVMEYQKNTYRLSLFGDFQNGNAALAIEVVKYLYPSITKAQIDNGLAKTKHDGRLETVLEDVIIDGAHNLHALKQVIFSLQTFKKVYNIHVLFSALSDKEPEVMLNYLKHHVKSITLTAFPDPRYKNLDFLPFNFEINPKTALQNLIQNKKENDVILITGSLHFIGYMKKEVIPYLK